jgi:hypothetical protein
VRPVTPSAVRQRALPRGEQGPRAELAVKLFDLGAIESRGLHVEVSRVRQSRTRDLSLVRNFSERSGRRSVCAAANDRPKHIASRT